MSGEDTEPGATFFQVFSTTFDKVHDPVFAPIEFEMDVDGRTARVRQRHDGVALPGRGERVLGKGLRCAARALKGLTPFGHLAGLELIGDADGNESAFEPSGIGHHHLLCCPIAADVRVAVR